MTQAQRDILLNSCPELFGRLEVLARDGRDIPDPFGGTVELYEQCRDVLERNLRQIVDELLGSESNAGGNCE